MKILEIGPGYERIEDHWVTLDCHPNPGVVDHIAKWGDSILPFDDETFDGVYSAHCLEHVPWYQTMDALHEVYRVLQPGGSIELWVPDFKKIVAAYLSESPVDDDRRHNHEGEFMLSVNAKLFSYGPNWHNWHRTVFDETSLRGCLTVADFVGIKRLEGAERGEQHGPVSLGMSAMKPG